MPYFAYEDADLYRTEQQLNFRGPVWNYLGLEIEVPSAGDYVATYVGETPVIVLRATEGGINTLVNRCAPAGARNRRGPPRTESVAIAQFSGAPLAQMMYRSSKLALRTGDEFKGAGEPEQDRQQHPQLHPAQQQANRFKTHLILLGAPAG